MSSREPAPEPIPERESLEKDTAYSPESERETAAKQRAPARESATAQDPEVDEEQVTVLPGTGGPDDVGDVEVDESELNLGGDSIPGHPKPGDADPVDPNGARGR